MCNTCVNSAFDLVCHKLDCLHYTFSLCFARSAQTAAMYTVVRVCATVGHSVKLDI